MSNTNTLTHYAPQPGTVAFRAFAYLESLPEGAEISSGQLAEAINVPSSNLLPCLHAALAAGKLFRRQKDAHPRSPAFWSLTDMSAQPRPTIPRGAPLPPKKPAAQAVASAPAAAAPAAEAAPNPAAASAPAAAPTPARPPASRSATSAPVRLALWSDGTLQIQRDAADVVLFTRDEARQIVSYLEAISLDSVRDAA
jgi:hypothetical protein